MFVACSGLFSWPLRRPAVVCVYVCMCVCVCVDRLSEGGNTLRPHRGSIGRNDHRNSVSSVAVDGDDNDDRKDRKQHQHQHHRRRSSTASSVIMSVFKRGQHSARDYDVDDDGGGDDGGVDDCTSAALAYLKRVDEWKAASEQARSAQHRFTRVKARVEQTAGLISLLDASPKVTAARTTFALGAAALRLLIFVILIGLMAVVSPLAFDYPSSVIATDRTMLLNGLSTTFGQVCVPWRLAQE